MFRKLIQEWTKIWLCLVVLCLLSTAVSGQKRAELEQRRKDLTRQIETTNKLLRQIKKDRKAAFNRLLALQKQIEKREELLSVINEELVYINNNIERTGEVVGSLEKDLASLEEEYKKMMQNAFRSRNQYNDLLYIFSAKDFNDAYRRWQYLKRYNEYRKKQVVLIRETQQSLSLKIIELEERRLEKEQLLVKMEEQQGLLANELRDKDKMVKGLRVQENSLRVDLANKEKSRKQLNSAIENVIREEIAKRTRKEGTKKTKSGAIPMTPSEKKLAKGFKANRGKLPWPVSQGIITGFFGTQKHPVLPKVEIKNNGIDIKTTANSEIRAVYEGKVVSVFYSPAFQNAVMIKHGDYFTVYANLGETFVKRNDEVKTKQKIGKVNTNPTTGKTEVHFEVWLGKSKLNPRYWIVKK